MPVTAEDRAQADATTCAWYSFLGLHGSGEFVDIMKRCNKSRDYTEIDNAIREKVKPYLYNGGQGKYVPAYEIVHVRQCIKNGLPVTPPTRSSRFSNVSSNGTNSRGNVKVSPSDIEAATEPNGIQLATNGVHQPSEKENMRLVCWDLYKRGAVGESLIHTCLLLANPLTLALAKRLLAIFPRMLVDIYLSDQYYGENILHLAIVNEDPAMVKYLLDRDSDGIIHTERAYGAFFSCDDQLASRKDQPDVEVMRISPKTNYKGYMYWGEYPLSFAACLGQEECLRLLFAKGADPTAQDHNGNTVLHILVIHNKRDMFDLVLSMSPPSLLTIKNNKGLTPLTLAAAMAHQDMYNHLIEKEREIYWVYGDVTCAAYPLDNIDTIGEQGEINPTSALHLIIHGEKTEHLDMVEGMVVNLLHEKWNTFVRFKFFLHMAAFLVYFIIIATALLLRPGTDVYAYTIVTANNTNVTRPFHNCYLLGPPSDIPYTPQEYARLTTEVMTICGVIIFLLLALRNLHHTGKERFIEKLKIAPSLTLFYMSCICVLLMIPGRFLCNFHANFAKYEDVLAVVATLLTAPYFLFFCRGFKMVGPFVIMIYKMLMGDLIRFVTIYFIFLIGFSQAMYIVHINYNPKTPGTTTPFMDPLKAFMGMFYMSMGEFKVMYDALADTSHEIMGKIIFLCYMVIVTLLLINMLIAMMGNTYTLVNETQKEWLRQWAHIVLAIEQSVTPGDRLKQQMRYSQPMANGKRALAIRWHQTEKEKEELKQTREDIRQKQREIVLKYSGSNSRSTSTMVTARGSRGSHLTVPVNRSPSAVQSVTGTR